ncbi:serine/threonine protein phosphatase PrpC [Nakamurella sp. UYEF19]|uniref:protein phosphatase 2C domain-containing protein n=1 Tax=Nakamurella sp. UYEF19 TaxID=1756392 RepID=UPI003398B098
MPLGTSSGTAGLSVDTGRIGPFDVYAATQLGFAHAVKCNPREDSYALGGVEGWTGCIVAVADGLGAARNSHAASLKAVRTAVDFLRDRIVPGQVRLAEQWTGLAPALVEEVCLQLSPHAVDSYAAVLGYRPLRDVPSRKVETDPACTLLVAAIELDNSGMVELAWASVGDCRLATVEPEGQLNWISAVSFDVFRGLRAGSLVSNAVDSLPKEPHRLQAGLVKLSAGATVLFASDGLTSAIDLAPDYFAEAIREMIDLRVPAHTFGALLDFQIRQLYDDRTLVAVSPFPADGG